MRVCESDRQPKKPKTKADTAKPPTAKPPIAGHFLEADLIVDIQFGGAKCLAFKTERRQPLKDIQGGH